MFFHIIDAGKVSVLWNLRSISTPSQYFTMKYFQHRLISPRGRFLKPRSALLQIRVSLLCTKSWTIIQRLLRNILRFPRRPYRFATTYVHRLRCFQWLRSPFTRGEWEVAKIFYCFLFTLSRAQIFVWQVISSAGQVCSTFDKQQVKGDKCTAGAWQVFVYLARFC